MRSCSDHYVITQYLAYTPDSETVTVIVAATKIQAKYKGYRVKGDYLRQREAGECSNAPKCVTDVAD